MSSTLVDNQSSPLNSGVDLCIINARIPGYQGLQQICINKQGIIGAIMPMVRGSKVTQESTQKLDMVGDWISLGGVDLQINGGLGLAFPDLSKEDIPKLQEIADFLWSQGVDAFLPTIITTAVDKIQQALGVIAEFMAMQASQTNTSRILGVHLEGPFLNYEKKGAHPQEYLLPLTLDNVRRVLGDYTSITKIITLAPELEPSGEVIAYLHSLGITVSLGHSLATAKEAHQAFSQGASMVTHGFNAMPSLHHRKPGLLAEAMANPQVFCGLIADGEHVNPLMIKLLLRGSKGSKGVFLVSDALAPIGLPDGVYPWDNRKIIVTQGTARLANGTLAGTTLPLLVGVQNLVKWGICDLGEAIAMATNSPRHALGLPGLEVGQPGNLLSWHWDEDTKQLSFSRLL